MIKCLTINRIIYLLNYNFFIYNTKGEIADIWKIDIILNYTKFSGENFISMVTFPSLHSGKEVTSDNHIKVTRLLYAGLPLNFFYDISLWKPLSTSFPVFRAKHVRSAMEKGDLLAFSSFSPTELCRDTSDCITLMDFDSRAAMMFLK